MNDSPGNDAHADEVLHYSGTIYVRPIGRGVVLEEAENQPHLDDILEEGRYHAEIRVRRVSSPKQIQAPSNAGLVNSDDGIRCLLREEGGCVSAEELARRYSPRRSVSETIDAAKAGRLIAHLQKSGEFAIPVWQFDVDGRLLPGIESALAMIRTDAPRYSDLFLFTFFLQADGRDPAMTPLEAIRRGDVDRALQSLRSLIFG